MKKELEPRELDQDLFVDVIRTILRMSLTNPDLPPAEACVPQAAWDLIHNARVTGADITEEVHVALANKGRPDLSDLIEDVEYIEIHLDRDQVGEKLGRLWATVRATKPKKYRGLPEEEVLTPLDAEILKEAFLEAAEPYLPKDEWDLNLSGYNFGQDAPATMADKMIKALDQKEAPVDATEQKVEAFMSEIDRSFGVWEGGEDGGPQPS